MEQCKQCDLLLLHSCVKRYLKEQCCQNAILEKNAKVLIAQLSSSSVPYGIKQDDLNKIVDWGYIQTPVTKNLQYNEFRQKLQIILNSKQQITSFSACYNILNSVLDEIIEIYSRDLNKPIQKSFGSGVQNKSIDPELEELYETYYLALVKYLDNEILDQLMKQAIAMSGKTNISTKSKETNKDEEDDNQIYEGINYHDLTRVNINKKYKYEKWCHFRDTITQYQGLQRKLIPEAVINDVKRMIQEHGLYDEKAEDAYEKVTKAHIRIFLGETKHNKYYEDCQLIYSKITGKPCPNIGKYEKQLYEDFDALVDAYASLKLERKNFLSNHYILNQLLRRQKYKVPSGDLNFLKTANRLKEHDEIYQKCCEILGWNFQPI
jgi:hypothetical protein